MGIARSLKGLCPESVQTPTKSSGPKPFDYSTAVDRWLGVPRHLRLNGEARAMSAFDSMRTFGETGSVVTPSEELHMTARLRAQ